MCIWIIDLVLEKASSDPPQRYETQEVSSGPTIDGPSHGLNSEKGIYEQLLITRYSALLLSEV